MPRGDGTGPKGQGPKTGRGLGPCNSNIPGQQNIKQSQQGQCPRWQRRVRKP